MLLTGPVVKEMLPKGLLVSSTQQIDGLIHWSPSRSGMTRNMSRRARDGKCAHAWVWCERLWDGETENLAAGLPVQVEDGEFNEFQVHTTSPHTVRESRRKTKRNTMRQPNSGNDQQR